MNIHNKVVVITGGSSGLGKELAYQFSRLDCSVVIAARNQSALNAIANDINASGGRCLAVPTDVSRRDQVESLVQKTLAAFNKIDIFISNAGISQATGTLMESQEDDIRSTLDVNLMGGIYGTWAAVPAMEKNGGGLLVFVTSVVGKRAVPFNSAYCASKFAVHGLTESIRSELKPKNIRVVTVCPPGIDTPFFENNHRGGKRRYRVHSAEEIARLVIRACRKESREAYLTIDSKILTYGNFLFPGLMDFAVEVNKGLRSLNPFRRQNS